MGAAAVAVPPQANSVLIKIKRTFNGTVLWDDVSFEKIKTGPKIQQGMLADRFDDAVLDPAQWVRAPNRRGTIAPRLQDGSLVYDDRNMHPLFSLAKFDDLLKYEGDQRYRLRLHVSTLPDATGDDTPLSLCLTSDRASLTRMLWYFYPSSPKRSQPMISNFNHQAGARKFSSSWPVKHLGKQGTDVWYSLYFDPTEVTIYASADGYHDNDATFVTRYKHEMTNLTATGSVYLLLFDGRYKLDDISLTRP